MTDAVTDQPAPASSSPEPRRASRPWWPLALLAAGQVLAGALVGLIWHAWAPPTVSYLVAGAEGQPAFVVPQESESQIAGDGRFVLLSVALGLVFGLLAWRVRASRGPAVLTALAGAGVLSSVLARAVGESLSGAGPARKLNAAFAPELTLHSLPALAVQAFFAVLVYTALVGLSGDPDLEGG